jgi:DNA-binding transcriptional LysR family regulator
MDSYRRMAVFVSVVKHGSLRRAAAALGLTPSAVSQQIRRLEEETGVVLLRRSTRQMTLTEAGRVFHEGCVGMVAATPWISSASASTSP